MNIHEYQAKSVLQQFGVSTSKGKVAYSPEQAVLIANELGGPTWVVKAQIHAGGRGKGGGVKLAKSTEEVKEFAKNILGMQLVTHQTGPHGKEVKRILIEKGCPIEKEYYLACVMDRSTSRIVMIGSSEGGMEIEKVASETPEKIHKEIIDPSVGLMSYQTRKLSYAMGIPDKLIPKSSKLMLGLYNAFISKDCSLVEINPLVSTKEGDVIALDAKLNFDDNALYRHADIAELRDLDEEDPNETQASRFDLSYVKLDGTIGCMVNGAGLAMATMDIIKLNGGEPANFLDVGGGATAEKVTEAFKIIVSDNNVNAILVNIFGGIMKCDTIAEGIVRAVNDVGLKVPLVVRLEGTNVEKGKEILKNSKLKIISAGTMKDAAEKVVAASKEGNQRK